VLPFSAAVARRLSPDRRRRIAAVRDECGALLCRVICRVWYAVAKRLSIDVQGWSFVTLQFERLFADTRTPRRGFSTHSSVISLVLFVAIPVVYGATQVDIARPDATRGSTQAEALGITVQMARIWQGRAPSSFALRTGAAAYLELRRQTENKSNFGWI